jgi:hypothetical protein
MLFVCFLWRGHGFWKDTASYGSRHVSVLASMLRRHGGHELVCVTDRPGEVPEGMRAIAMPDEVAALPNYLPKLRPGHRGGTEPVGQRGVALMADPIFPGTSQHLVLIDLVKTSGFTRGAEIGVLKGKTLFHCLDACPGLSLIGVDQWIWLPPSEDGGSETYEKFDMHCLRAHVMERAKTYGNRCTILEGDSAAMAAHVADASLDYVFIDASHTYESVKRDIAAWAPKVRLGGMVTGHDWQWPSVARALNEILPGWTPHAEQVWSIARA